MDIAMNDSKEYRWLIPERLAALEDFFFFLVRKFYLHFKFDECVWMLCVYNTQYQKINRGMRHIYLMHDEDFEGDSKER